LEEIARGRRGDKELTRPEGHRGMELERHRTDKHAQMGVFYMFGGRGWIRDVPNE